jgi:thymidylate synthase (FAD)
MKLIKSSVEIIPQKEGIQGIYEQIELAARTCYKSECLIKYDENGNSLTAKDFVDKIVNVYKHQSVAEHGTVYLLLITPIQNLEEYETIADFYNKNPFSVVYKVESGYGVGLAPNYKSNNQGKTCYYITTNYRVLLENNRLGDLQYLCDPTEYHQKRVTVRVKCPISVSREWNRHRDLCKTSEEDSQYFSPSEQSTRYCNYSKDKFNNEIQCTIPSKCNHMIEGNSYDWELVNKYDIKQTEGFSSAEESLIKTWCYSEFQYMKMLAEGCKPEEAREALTLCTATEVVYTGFVSDWKAFFNLRCSPNAHPDIMMLADKLKEQFKENKLI